MRSRLVVAAAVVAAVIRLLSLTMSFGGAAAAGNPGGGRVVLPSTVAAAVARSQKLGDVAADEQISVAVLLKLRHTADLDRFLTAVGTPGTPEYGHYLTPERFLIRYGPSRSAVAKVSAHLTAHGLAVTDVSANRQVVRARGTAGQIDAAFGTHEGTYRDPQARRTYFANDAAASLPADVAAAVEGVSGLNNHTVQSPHLAGREPGRRTAAVATPSGLGPAQYDGAYQLDRMGADGAGSTVALWEFAGYAPSDLRTYDAQFGLSGPAVTTVPVDGTDYGPAPRTGLDEAEVELDSEIVRGVAPKAAQLVYEAQNSDLGEIDMAAQIVTENRASVISISWGSCELDTTPSTMTAVDNSFRQAAAQGISVFSASGDDGSRDCTRSAGGPAAEAVEFPASDPFVTGVGGTTLRVAGDAYASETAWSGSGGGVSSVFAKPAWQSSTGLPGGMRTVPDVASAADSPGGFVFFAQGASGPAWEHAGGTSAAAPLWAGFAALYDQRARTAGRPALGEADPKLYRVAAGAAYGASLHDVTKGANQDFGARSGYDQVTGWGTPIADALATTLLNAHTVTVADPGDRTGTVGSADAMKISATDSGAGPPLAHRATGRKPGLSSAFPVPRIHPAVAPLAAVVGLAGAVGHLTHVHRMPGPGRRRRRPLGRPAPGVTPYQPHTDDSHREQVGDALADGHAGGDRDQDGRA